MKPTSQKADARPIVFEVYDTASAGGTLAQMQLIIRPEELTLNEPARVLAHQTLGGAWVDDFGQGIPLLDLSGTTGWHGNQQMDGEALFRALHTEIFQLWYGKRAEKAAAGQDPDEVEMIYADSLDQLSLIVAPQRFQLKRTKSKPLLSYYSISLIVLSDAGAPKLKDRYDPIWSAVDNPVGRYPPAAIALQANISDQQAALGGLGGIFGDITGSVQGLVGKSNEILGAVLAAGQEAAGQFDAATAPLLYAALSMQKAAANAFSIMAVPYGVVQNALFTIMQIGSRFQAAYCTLLNGFGLLRQILDIESLFGASYCSSTAGGRPLTPFADQNPFYTLFQQPNPPVTISDDAAQAISVLQQDPLQVNGADGIGGLMDAISRGVVLN